jgi:ATP-dependent RNA helicase DDX23/PRP28
MEEAPAPVKKQPQSMEVLVAARRAADEAAARPVFLSKAERERIKAEEEKAAAAAVAAAAPAVSTVTVSRSDRDGRSRGQIDVAARQAEREREREREREQEVIRQRHVHVFHFVIWMPETDTCLGFIRYLGAAPQQRKFLKASERSKQQNMDWDVTDDTTRDSLPMFVFIPLAVFLHL